MSRKRLLLFAALTSLAIFGLAESVMHVLAPEGSGREQGFVGHSDSVPYFVKDERQRAWVPNRSEMSRHTRLSFTSEEGGIRVAAFGGSTIASNPPDGPAWQLAAMLHLGTGGHSELVNGGGHGFGSTRVRGALTELLSQELDAVVLYTGHNEFTESRYVPSLSLQGGWGGFMRQLRRHSRVYEGLRLGIRDLSGQPHAVSSEVPGGPLRPGERTRLRERFRANLESMAQSMKVAGVPGVWVLPASNLGMEPEASNDGRGIHSVSDQSQALRRAVMEVDSDAASRLSEEILSKQPNHALGHFARGRTLAMAGDRAGALQALRLARDEDQVPRRATSALVQIMREVAQRHGIAVVDAEAVLLAADPERTMSGGYSADRMHLNAVGYRVVMLEVYKALGRQLRLRDVVQVSADMPVPGASLRAILGPLQRTVAAPTLGELEHKPRDKAMTGGR